MHKRDTEREHELADQVFRNANIFDLQGLLLTKEYNFSAALEAVYLDEDEDMENIKKFFSQNELYAKHKLAQKLNIPFYIVAHQKPNDFFNIFTMVLLGNEIVIGNEERKSFEEFILWWSTLKGTPQTKGFRVDAQLRTQESIIDTLLEKNRLAWGGNVDGIIISQDYEQEIIGIVEKRISDVNLENYDPADFFYHPTDPLRNDHFTWKPLIKLAIELQCPLYLLTFNKTNNKSYGYSHIKTIINGLQYWTHSPKSSVTDKIEDFISFINNNKQVPTETGYCFTCGRSITDNALNYCLNNRRFFKGKVYCFTHQQEIRNN